MSLGYKFLGLLIVAIAFSSCIENKDTEEERPQIELISPKACEPIYFGETFEFSVKITDNTGMGNISLDIHNNFGQHNHGSHSSCTYDSPKDAVNPYEESWIYELPTEKKEHVFKVSLDLPAMKDETTRYDEGDYHFHIYVTDNDGYQTFTSLDVKALYK